MKTKTSLLQVLLAGAVILPASLHASTIAWWRFEDTGTTLVNSAETGAIYNATLGADASLTTITPDISIKDQNGNIYSNSGSYQNVANPGSALSDPQAGANLAPVFTGSFTIEAFVYTNSNPGWRAIFNQDDQTSSGLVIFGFNSNGHLRFYATNGNNGNQGVTAPSTLTPLNQWVHVAAVGTKTGRDTLVQLYIDGEAVGTPTNFWNGITLNPSSTNVLGGINSWNASSYLDEIRISDAALTPEQFLTAVPETSTYAYMALGLGVSWLLLRKGKKAINP